jgi:hypothetical protein
MGDREKRTLSLLTGAIEHSPLTCQYRVIGEGVQIRLPEGMFA